MDEKVSRELLKISIAQIGKEIGFESIEKIALEIFTDIIQKL